MRVNFTKMQSLGNDFVVLDGVTKKINLTPSVAGQLADRRFGVGCDQILLAEPSAQADFGLRIFNQDGSEAEQCGNGARCFARFLQHQNLTAKDKITVQTINRLMTLNLLDNGDVCVNMNVPDFVPEQIPFIAEQESDLYALKLDSAVIQISALSIGNPHAVTRVDDVDTAAVLTLGALIERHPRFPHKANAGFMQIVDRNVIRLRVYERGVGETLGCGSGACAAVVAGIRLGLLAPSVAVHLPGGTARVSWQGAGQPVYLSGSAYNVFAGVIEVPAC